MTYSEAMAAEVARLKRQLALTRRQRDHARDQRDLWKLRAVQAAKKPRRFARA